MSTVENISSDFELLIHLVRELKRFSYKDLQDTIGKIQVKHRLFQTYFSNGGDIEGVNPPESMQLSFHFKVLHQLGYVDRVGREYVASKKYEEENKGKHQNTDSEVVREMLLSLAQH
jgi:hypothetical protein